MMRGSTSSAVRSVGTNGPPLVFRLKELKAFSKTLPEQTHPLFLPTHKSRRYSLSVRSSGFQLRSELAQPGCCMNYLLRPRIWPSFLASSGVPSTGSGQAHPATYRSGTPRNQLPAVARWHAHLIRARSAPLSPASGFPVS